jgi:hypothetical protein
MAYMNSLICFETHTTRDFVAGAALRPVPKDRAQAAATKMRARRDEQRVSMVRTST